MSTNIVGEPIVSYSNFSSLCNVFLVLCGRALSRRTFLSSWNVLVFFVLAMSARSRSGLLSFGFGLKVQSVLNPSYPTKQITKSHVGGFFSLGCGCFSLPYLLFSAFDNFVENPFHVTRSKKFSRRGSKEPLNVVKFEMFVRNPLTQFADFSDSYQMNDQIQASRLVYEVTMQFCSTRTSSSSSTDLHGRGSSFML